MCIILQTNFPETQDLNLYIQSGGKIGNLTDLLKNLNFLPYQTKEFEQVVQFLVQHKIPIVGKLKTTTLQT